MSRGFDNRLNLVMCVNLKLHSRSIWCTHEHSSVPEHTLSRRENGTQMAAFRDDMSTPWSRTNTIVLILLVSHLGAFPDYMQSMSEVCATVCGSMPFAHSTRCVGLLTALRQHTCPVRRMSTLYPIGNLQVTISHTHWRQCVVCVNAGGGPTR